ncbi:glycosyltransferase family 4 protein [Tellurirhabdus bombi]|uniref:glycosyltransferase family 4 protein n=1 Tax=Tellurirhabdus bombi TaxID=2907205 RepID=UPI001F228F88|nr:glycosyltransferase family 1 protein [Tellurirhabdus bombi]
MNIFIDTERLRDPHSGLGQFCQLLGQELVRQQPPGAGLTFLVPAGHTEAFGQGVSYQQAGWWRRLWKPNHFDVWHCTHQDSVYLPHSGQNDKSKLILTIHDLNFLERPDYDEARKAQRLAFLQQKISQAAALTTISEYTASVVRQQFTLPDVPLRVIYNGTPLITSTEPPESSLTAALAEGPFFLFVGAIHPKKNLHTLLPLLEAFPDWKLVLAGVDQHPYAAHLRDQASQLDLSERLEMPGAVSEATKQWLYQQCGALLFPSLSEGFGLPVVEAMHFGKPVFLSRLTSLPEIGGKDAYYFNSFEPEDMAETIYDGLSDFAANPFRAARLRQRAAQFSWEEAARAYWALYSEIGLPHT